MASQINKNIQLTDEENSSLESLKQIRTVLYSGTREQGLQGTIQLSDDSYNYKYLQIHHSDFASCNHLTNCYPGNWHDLTTANWIQDSNWMYLSCRVIYIDHMKITTGHDHLIWFRPETTEKMTITTSNPMSIISVIGIK